MFNYNISNLGTGSRTTTGIVPLSGTAATGSAASGVIDTSNTDWVSFGATVTGSATAQVETSFDNGVTWYPIYNIRGVDGTTQSTITASGLYFGNSIGSLTRINVTAVSGTFAVTGGTTDVTNAPNGTSGANSPSSNVISTPANSSTYNANTTAAALAATIKASAGNLCAFAISNVTAATIYVKLYNKASNPAPATDIPFITIPVAAAATAIQEFGDEGMRFTAGIAIGVTAAAGDTDTSAVTAGAHISIAYS